MKKLLMTTLLAALMAESCSKEEKVTETQPKTEVKQPDSVERASGFEAFGRPENIQGCSCAFGATDADFQAGQFVYVDDYGNQAQVMLNGKMEFFPMEEGDFLPDNFNKKLENAQYELEISGKKASSDPELLRFEGTLRATDKKTKKQFTTPIVGECAC